MRCGLLLLAGCAAAPAAATDEGTSGGASSGEELSSSSVTGSSTGAPVGTAAATNDSANPATSGCATGCTESGESTTDPGPSVETECSDQFDGDKDGFVDCFDADCWSQSHCADRFVSVATWNIRQVGIPGSQEYDALIAVLDRIDVDIVCLQEVGDEDSANLDAVAEELGYFYGVLAPPRPGSGMIRNACLSRFEVVQSDVVDDFELSSDPNANDMTRGIVRARVYLQGIDRYLTLLNVHLKAGVEDVDRFRRMVETVRVAQAIELERGTYPNNAIIALGDFNEVPDHGITQTWNSVPSPVPGSYRLGNDIALPLTYDPMAAIEAEDVTNVEALLEDTFYGETYLPGLLKLDYLYEDAAPIVVSEVYDSCEDDGEDKPPVGDILPKVGEPLPCGTNGVASDHRPLVAVFYFP